MKLPIQGHPLHTRSLTIIVSQREGGGWKVHGEIIDLRKCSFVPLVDDIQPAGIIHHMRIDLGFDPETGRIDSMEVDQPVVAVEPSGASFGESCRDPAPRLLELVGEAVDENFAKRLASVFGGALGCSHLLTLFQLMAATLVRAQRVESALVERKLVPREVGERLFRRSAFIDGFEVDAGLELGIQMSDFHVLPRGCSERSLERFEEQAEVRVYGVVEMPSRGLVGLRAAERVRGMDSLHAAPWIDRGDLVASLEGASTAGGFARRVLGALEDPDAMLLRDALLQLAPGFIQAVAALTERFFPGSKRPTTGPGPQGADSGAALGGMPDSCYIWRGDGPMLRVRQERFFKAKEEAPS